MTSDIHPHWKNVGAEEGVPPSQHPVTGGSSDSFWPMPEEAQLEAPKRSQVHRIRVARSGISLLLVFTLVPLTLAALAFVFLQGVNLIRADLTAGVAPDWQIDITDIGFSQQNVAAKAGDLVEWRNTGNAPQQFRSAELNTDGSPLLQSSLLQPGETFRMKVPEFLAGKTLTLHSAFIPTMVSTVTVAETHLSAAPAPPPPPPPAPTPPPPSPTLTPPPVTPAPASATINVGMAEMVPSNASAWPALLRTNPFTVDRVASLSPTAQLPIHSVARTREKVKSSEAKRLPLARPDSPVGRARKQPETGPALWIVATLSLCGVSLLLKRSGRM